MEGLFGKNCDETCGKCLDTNQCNHITGNCEQCQENFVAPQCNRSKYA